MSLFLILGGLKERKAARLDCRALSEELHSELSNRFRGGLRAMAHGELADEDDILVDAWEAVLRNAHNFQGNSEGEAYNYCRRAVTTRALDAWRKAGKRWIRKGTGRPGGKAGDESDETRRSEEDPIGLEEMAQRAEEKRRFHEALLRLKPNERELIIRNDLNGQKIREIANETGEKENTLSVRRIRALAKLRAILENPDF